MQAHTAFAPPSAASDGAVRIEALTGRVLVDGAEIVLCPTYRLLVCALARCAHPVPREQLQALIWPDDEAARARNLLNMALHRLRKRLGDRAVVQTPEGYRLGDAVVLDLREVEALAVQLRGSRSPDLATAVRWLPVVRRVCCGCERSASDPEFVGTLERRMQTAARDITNRLAEYALTQLRPDLALELVRAALDFDACDESAREIAIRAHLALGDRAAAIREYRDYTRALTEDLGLAPSFTLASLVA
jgi:DNA-binding SARP family transcriptional activator